MGREPKEKVRFARLKEALSKLEQPPAVQAAEPATGGTQDSLMRKATEDSSDSGMPADSLRPTLGFKEAMRNSRHPDFGLSFSSALQLALAKQKEENSLESTLEHWAVEGDDEEASVEDAAVPIIKGAKTAVGVAAGSGHNDKIKSTKMQATQQPVRTSSRRSQIGCSYRLSGRRECPTPRYRACCRPEGEACCRPEEACRPEEVCGCSEEVYRPVYRPKRHRHQCQRSKRANQGADHVRAFPQISQTSGQIVCFSYPGERSVVGEGAAHGG